jgi:hypothetical protein
MVEVWAFPSGQLQKQCWQCGKWFVVDPRAGGNEARRRFCTPRCWYKFRSAARG